MVIDDYQIALRLAQSVILVVFSGCAVVSEPPVVDKSTTQKVFVGEQRSSKTRFGAFRPSKVYQVKKGDTLYSIAWKYGVSYRMLADQNNIDSPFLIYPGQKLSVSTAKKKIGVSTKLVKSQDKKVALSEKMDPQSLPSSEEVSWVWPVQMKPSIRYSSKNKGVDYLLAKSTSLVAAGKGSVVYEGGGIGGFENLIIIKHSNELLSAYSFNGGAAIKEKQIVKSGDVLARISPDSKKGESVHFEVRKNGRPIDPSTLIKVSI